MRSHGLFGALAGARRLWLTGAQQGEQEAAARAEQERRRTLADEDRFQRRKLEALTEKLREAQIAGQQARTFDLLNGEDDGQPAGAPTSAMERRRQRVLELMESEGLTAAQASARVRQEYAMDPPRTPRPTRPVVSPNDPTKTLPVYERAVREADNEVQEARRGAPKPLGPFAPPADSVRYNREKASADERVQAALARRREAQQARDSVRAERLGTPKAAPMPHGDTDDDAVQALYDEAAEAYRAALAEGMNPGEARKLFDAAVAGITRRAGRMP